MSAMQYQKSASGQRRRGAIRPIGKSRCSTPLASSIARWPARLSPLGLLLGLWLSAMIAGSSASNAQNVAPAARDAVQQRAAAQRLAEEALADKAEQPPSDPTAKASAADRPRINLLELFFKGGYLIYPIAAMSVIVLIYTLERALALRRRRVVPRAFVRDLRELMENRSEFNLKAAYRLCQEYPCAAATVIRTALLKIGRPQLEIERAVSEVSESEAARLHTNVRPILLAATVSPLLGLLGTVWGMIEAFFVTASNPMGSNRAEMLAGGIYVALVTTFAGLAVAIPAAVLAHYFEGRIQARFREIDGLAHMVLARLVRFEGKVSPQVGLRLQQADVASTAAALGHEVERPEPTREPIRSGP